MQPENLPTQAPQSAPVPIRALVIEDDETDRFRLMTMCRRAGLDLDFHEASDADEIRDQIATTAFDLIFIDYHLGFFTGLEALAEISACDLQVNAVLIMVTSANQHEIIIDAMKNGCSDYLIKETLSIDGIQKSVATAFERRLVQSVLQDERANLASLRDAVSRFNDVTAVEMKRIMAAMLWRVRMKADSEMQTHGRVRYPEIEALCFEAIALTQEGRIEIDTHTPRISIDTTRNA